MTKIVVVGAGVVGCAAARELSKYDADVTVLERCFDVCEGTSKANSGIVHAGFDAEPGTNKAKFNRLGNAMFDKASNELDFPFKRNGAMVVCFDKSRKSGIEDLYQKGIKNGIKNLEIISGEQARQIEPNLSEEIICALYAKDSGIVCPYEMTWAYAENANKNGARFVFGEEVEAIESLSRGFNLKTKNGGVFYADVVVNCAGLYADAINNMAGCKKLEIIPRRGEYILMDMCVGKLVSSTVFQQPTNMGKGILVTPTTHGNTLVGPTAYDIDDKEDVCTTMEGLALVFERGQKSVPTLSKKTIITQFAGNRAHEKNGDFVVGWAKNGFFNIAGIESPGLTSAPALAVFAAEEIASAFSLKKKQNFDPTREGIPHLSEMNEEERKKLIEKNPLYAKIVCRCETVSEGEILDSIRRPLGAKDLDGVKRRTRTGMGRCQSGFCFPRVVEILSEELNIPMTEVRKNSKNGYVVTGRTKQ